MSDNVVTLVFLCVLFGGIFLLVGFNMWISHKERMADYRGEEDDDGENV